MISYAKISKMTLIYIMLLALFSRYTEHYYLWKVLFLAMFGYLFTCKKVRMQLSKIFINKYFVIMMGVILFSTLISSNNTYLVSNLKLLLWPILFMITIVSIYLSEPQIIYDVLKKTFVPLNILLVVNLLILVIQCNGTPIFIKESWRQMNSYYEDLCCGLFGYNGTHELTMFLLFMNAFNLYHYKMLKKNKGAFLFYIIIIDLLIALLSTKNDNIAMFLLLPLFLIVYLVSTEYFKTEKIKSLLNKFGKYIGLAFVLLLVALAVPNIRAFIDEYVLIRVKMVANVTNVRYQINGSNERLAIPLKALYSKEGWLIGQGIGSASYGGGDFFGYNHFGLSSIGTLVMTGGIWFYLTYTLFYTKTIMKMIKSKHIFPEMLCFFLIIFLTIYTIFYTSFVTTIWYTLFFMLLGCEKNNVDIKKVILAK